MENKLNELYKQIINIVVQIIPEKWKHVVLYAEVSDEMRTVHFFYYSINKDIFISGWDIIEHYSIDETIFRIQRRDLVQLINQLHQTFITHDQEPWTNLTMRIDHSGKFNIEFHYDDFTEIDAYARLMLWKHMIAKIHLQDSFEIRSANDYIKYLLKHNLKYNNLPVELIQSK